ncbi:response regulator [Dactylosporangium sp. CA-139066]|uniref:response regulator n=1 Tax=Dactylosporangium sp. CA-139066 TaxID=3239930 RepID=UPI003D9478FE
MTKVLIVDDDEPLLRALRLNFAARGYEVRTAGSAAAGLAAAADHPPDLVVVDLGLPDLDGLDVVTGIREYSTVPIIVLSARHGGPTKVAALDAGADDYVTKPFGMDELLARMRAALRRAAPAPAEPVIEASSFRLDLSTKQATGPDGRPVRLTPTEWHLLEVLVRHAGKLVEHRQLLREVWGPQYETETNYLRVHFANLRRKLEADPSRPRHLITEPGIGYRLDLTAPGPS